MKPIYNHDTGEFRIEHDGRVIYGPVAQYSWPVNKDEDAIDAILNEGNVGQPQREMWKMVFGVIDLEHEGEIDE